MRLRAGPLRLPRASAPSAGALLPLQPVTPSGMRLRPRGPQSPLPPLARLPLITKQNQSFRKYFCLVSITEYKLPKKGLSCFVSCSSSAPSTVSGI